MSYLIAAYAVVALGVAGYAGWLARTRQRLAREVANHGRANRG